MRNDDLNDTLADMLDGAPERPAPHPPKHYVPITERFNEPCRKCGGSGRYRGIGQCFTCDGSGRQQFKTSPETRKANRNKAAERKGRALADYIAAHKPMMDWLANTARANAERGGNFTFPQEMIDKVAKYGSLTDGQQAAVERMMAREAIRNTERAAERAAIEANAPTVDARKLEKAFATARSKASRPGQMGVWVKPLHLQGNDMPLTFSPGSERWAGMIFVKTGDRRLGTEKKLGAIKAGKFTRRIECTDAEEAAVLDACNDPLKAAIAYGKAWSRCAVCSQTLTNDGSIERGIGPVCAAKYGWAEEASDA